MQPRKHHYVLLLALCCWYANGYDFVGDSMMKFMMQEEEDSGSGSGVPEHESLTSFEELLSDMHNTDLLIMVDVCEAATEFLGKLKKISTDAVRCMQSFTENDNSVAVMTFSSNATLLIDFDDKKCMKDDDCILKKSNDIREKKEKRNLKKALRKAQKLFLKRQGNETRKRLILLITFGIDQVKDNSPTNSRNKYISEKLASKFKSDNITLAVVGIGEEAMRNQQFFKTLLEPQTEEHLLLSKDGYILEILEVSVKFSCHAAYDMGSFGRFKYLL